MSLIFQHTSKAAESVSADLSIDRVYDNNLFRLADSADSQAIIGSDQTNDVINRLSAQLNLELPLGLQKVRGHAAVVANRFERNKQLDYDGLDLMLGWDGKVGKIWKGNIQWNRKQTLANFSNFQGSEKNILTHNNMTVGLRREISARWLMWSDWEQSSYSRSLVSQQRNDRRTNNIRLGITGRSSAGSELNIFTSSRTVDFVNLNWFPGALQDDELREDGLNLKLKWKITSNTTVDGGVGIERVMNPNLSQNDFSGSAYDIALVWDDNGVLNWQAESWRNIDTITSAYGSYVIRKGGRLSIQWSIRTTLLLITKMSIERLNYDDRSTTSREDVLHDRSISLLYKPLHNTDINLTYVESNRDSTALFGDFRSHLVQLGISIHWE